MKYLLCQLVLMINSGVLGNFITNDYGTLTMLLLSTGQYCFNEPGSDVYQLSVKFHGTFARVPQLVIFLNEYNIHKENAQFTLSIPEINQKGCTIEVQCLLANPVYTLVIKWLAIDDDRITVINNFNVDTAIFGNQIITHSHTNKYASVGFIVLTNFGYTGPFDIQLEIVSITSDKVNVQLTQGSSNLLMIGYQIVLGTLDSFTVSNVITQSNFQNFTLILPTNYYSIPFSPFSGLNWEQTDSNLTLSLQLEKESSYQISYQLSAPGTTYTSLNYQQVSINKLNNRVLVPYLYQRWRASKKQDYSTKQTQLQVKGTLYICNVGQQLNAALTNAQPTITIVTSFRCSSGQKISGRVLQCIDCLIQFQVIQSLCFGGMNLIEHYFIYFQKDLVYGLLDIKVTETKITVTQKTLGPQGTLLSLELITQ